MMRDFFAAVNSLREYCIEQDLDLSDSHVKPDGTQEQRTVAHAPESR